MWEFHCVQVLRFTRDSGAQLPALHRTDTEIASLFKLRRVETMSAQKFELIMCNGRQLDVSRTIQD